MPLRLFYDKQQLFSYCLPACLLMLLLLSVGLPMLP
jgi:hypothetical protein